MKSLFEFIDYRKFLEHYYKEKKKSSRHFSYRYFAQKTGINSPSFLKHVIDDKRNLTTPVIEKFSKALKLTKKEIVYFRHLVLFNQAKPSHEKQEHYAVLRSMSQAVKESILKSSQFDYFDKWYSVIIRELVCLYDFRDDYKKLAKAIVPPITASEVKKAVKVLLDLKLIRRKSNRTYVQSSQALAVDDTITSMAVRSFTENMREHAKSALHAFDKSERHISGITLGISKATYEVLTAEIDAFKDRVKTIVNRDEDSSQVYQINISLFPASVDVNDLDGEKDTQV
jgi:uncharacterized protein (TIGR02147 family)